MKQVQRQVQKQMQRQCAAEPQGRHSSLKRTARRFTALPLCWLRYGALAQPKGTRGRRCEGSQHMAVRTLLRYVSGCAMQVGTKPAPK